MVRASCLLTRRIMARLRHTFGDYRRQGPICRASSASSAGAKLSGSAYLAQAQTTAA
jgi:hypothetical protein